jgi:PelA/Pel-15E family pectate lyase
MISKTMKTRILVSFLCLIQGALAFPEELLEKPDDWFRSEPGKTAVANVLSWQAESGSWPKNQDNSKKPFSGKQKKTGTFDNGSTTDELRFLARAFEVTADPANRAAFLKGYDHVLEAQFPNGGWPQYFPLSKQYHRHITFNDNSMTRILEFLRDVTTSKRYDFIGAERRAAGSKAFDAGISCILKCQVVRNGKPTVWCAQHDEITLKPAMARSYELESLSGSESAGILRFLMSIEKPSPEIIAAVRAGVEWFAQSKVDGIRIEKIKGVRTAVTDPKATPLWARFYDIETNRPFFCDRDGVKKWNYNEIGKERRNGYAWYGNWGESVAKAYAKWSHR